VAVFLPKTYDANLIRKLSRKKKLSGVILLLGEDMEEPSKGFSEDTPCPNAVSSLYQSPNAGACR